MKKKNRNITIVALLILVLLLTPIRINLQDGVCYKALLYEVTQIKQSNLNENGYMSYTEGLELKVLGKRIFRETLESGDESVKVNLSVKPQCQL